MENQQKPKSEFTQLMDVIEKQLLMAHLAGMQNNTTMPMSFSDWLKNNNVRTKIGEQIQNYFSKEIHKAFHP